MKREDTMGEIVLTAKVTHVPTMLLSERPGRLYGTRAQAIEGHREIGRRARGDGPFSHGGRHG